MASVSSLGSNLRKEDPHSVEGALLSGAVQSSLSPVSSSTF